MNKLKTTVLMAALAAMPLSSFAAEKAAKETAFSNPVFNTLLAVIVILAIIVIALGGALKNLVGSDLFVEKLKKARESKGAPGKAMLLALMLLGAQSFAQVVPAAPVAVIAPDNTIGGLDQVTFYTMLSIIAAELLVIGILFRTFRSVLGPAAKTTAAVPAKKKKTVLDKINATVTLEEEEAILLDHEYDGIRELDNVLPPWWKYGFYVTILVAVVYMIAYHVTDTLPLQKEEYKADIAKAEAEVAAYMKNSAGNVDENTVKLLTEASDVNAGKDLFITACAACHGKLGEGGVGPNLTDDYWMHSGGVKDIFKTIKYGWPDKGMKSWKDDFSPMQIAQLTSFIKTLKGTNPPNAKEKQGELYTEAEQPAPAPAPQSDTLNGKLTSQVIK